MSFLEFLSRQWTAIPEPSASFTNQTIIVTGSNIGLGFEAAQQFVRLGAGKVILAVRSISKGEKAAASIHASTERNGVCEVWHLDMGNFDSVKEFVRRAQTLERLDVVVENAGIASSVWNEMEEMEATIAVNVVGTFLLALGMLPILREKGRNGGGMPKLVILASDVHAIAKFNERHEESIFGALKKQTPTAMNDRYPTSKILDVFMVRALTEHVNSGPHASEPVIINAVNPGLCHSSLSRNITGITSLFFETFKLLLARRTDVGARTIVAGAAAGPESHGKYMSESTVMPPSPFVTSEEGQKTQERVYSELMEIVEKIQPGISKNV